MRRRMEDLVNDPHAEHHDPHGHDSDLPEEEKVHRGGGAAGGDGGGAAALDLLDANTIAALEAELKEDEEGEEGEEDDDEGEEGGEGEALDA